MFFRTPHPAALFRFMAGVFCLLGMGLSLQAADPTALKYDKDIQPLLSRYCQSCHGEKEAEGDLNLTLFPDVLSIQKSRRHWLAVIEQLRTGMMPPRDHPRKPTDAEREQIAGWVEWTLNNVDCEQMRNPGRVTLRRLNTTEYERTLRDLLGVNFNATAFLPSDGEGGTGFDTNADALFVPPLLMEKYFQAADRILLEAIPPPPIDVSTPGGRLLPAAKEPSDGPRTLDKDYETRQAHLTVRLPREGAYEFRVRAWSEAGKPPAKFDLKIDDRTARSFTVRSRKEGENDAAPVATVPGSPLLQGAALQRALERQKAAGAKTTADPFVLTFTRRMNAGMVKVGVEFTARGETAPLIVEKIEISGPTQGGGSVEDSVANKLIFVAVPDDNLSAEAAGRRVLGHVMRRAYRRPVTDAELNWAMGLFKRAEQRGDPFSECVRLALKGVLITPQFLFRREADGPDNRPYRISDWELASRMSYFLWSSMPDDELLSLAEGGKLKDPDVIEKQVKRMLADPRSRALADRFATQWLGIDELGKTHRPDRNRFPAFTRSLRDAMEAETVGFFDHIVRENRSLLELIDSDYTFLNEELAKHYGIAGVKGPEMRKVTLRDRNRGGVLTMGSTLTVSSYPLRTSPSKRGTWILERIMGTPPPPPLPDAGSLPGDDKQNDGLSFRQRLARHRVDPKCASCHERIDPLGFGFENFDAIGQYRTQGVGGTIDASGVLPGGRAFNGPAELKKIFIERRQQVIRSLAEKMLAYALGRNLQYYDVCAVNEIVAAVEKDNYRAQQMITRIILSYPFQYRVNNPEG